MTTELNQDSSNTTKPDKTKDQCIEVIDPAIIEINTAKEYGKDVGGVCNLKDIVKIVCVKIKFVKIKSKFISILRNGQKF